MCLFSFRLVFGLNALFLGLIYPMVTLARPNNEYMRRMSDGKDSHVVSSVASHSTIGGSTNNTTNTSDHALQRRDSHPNDGMALFPHDSLGRPASFTCDNRIQTLDWDNFFFSVRPWAYQGMTHPITYLLPDTYPTEVFDSLKALLTAMFGGMVSGFHELEMAGKDGKTTKLIGLTKAWEKVGQCKDQRPREMGFCRGPGRKPVNNPEYDEEWMSVGVFAIFPTRIRNIEPQQVFPDNPEMHTQFRVLQDNAWELMRYYEMTPLCGRKDTDDAHLCHTPLPRTFCQMGKRVMFPNSGDNVKWDDDHTIFDWLLPTSDED